MPPECDHAKVVAESASAVRTAAVMRFMCCPLMVVASVDGVPDCRSESVSKSHAHNIGCIRLTADGACLTGGGGVVRWVVNGGADNLAAEC